MASSVEQRVKEIICEQLGVGQKNGGREAPVTTSPAETEPLSKSAKTKS